MMMILSPSKGQNFAEASPFDDYTVPKYLTDSQLLMHELRQFDSQGIQTLMKVSQKLADLNVQRYQDFTTPFTLNNAKQAIFAFKGDVYNSINIRKYNQNDLAYAQQHLRILSGLYGCLRPLDLIQAYRLEMKTKLNNSRGMNLYQFWGNRLTESLNTTLATHKHPILINLASIEYFKAIKAKLLQARLLTLNFKEQKNGKTRVIAIFAKRARGMMTDFILRNRIENPTDIQQFNQAGYQYSAIDSNDKQWTFIRPQP